MDRGMCVAATLLIGMVCSSGRGETYTDSAHGALQLVLNVNQTSSRLINQSGSSVRIERYELSSFGGWLDPGRWTPSGGVAVSSTSTQLQYRFTGSLLIGAYQTLDLGGVFPGMGSGADVLFYYTRPDAPGDRFLGTVRWGVDLSEVIVRKFNDKDRDGVFNGDDEWLPGGEFSVDWTNDAYEPRTVTTGRNGTTAIWSSSSSMGAPFFTVSEQPQPGWVPTTPTVVSGQQEPWDIPACVEFGAYYVPEPATLTLLALAGLGLRKRPR